MLALPVDAAVEPAVRALGRAGGVVAVDVERGALVERQRDVGTERGLDLHARLRPHEALAAVDVGAEAHALLADLEDAVLAVAGAAALDLLRHRPLGPPEHLKTAPGGGGWAPPRPETVGGAR